MRKFTLLIALLFVAIVAMAQTFVEPEVGKFYKIKGDHETNHWVAVTTAGSSVVMSSSEESAAVFYKTENGFQEVTTKNYLGYTGGKFTFSSTSLNVELRNTGNCANSEGKYAIVSGGNYMYNNSADGIAHESSGWLDIPRLWGFIEVDYDSFNNKVFALESYMDYLYSLTDGTTNIYTNGSYSGTADTRALWKPVLVSLGVYKIQNVHTGLYIGATNHSNSVQMSETPGSYEITTAVGSETVTGEKFYIKVNGQNACLHSTAATAKGWEGGGLGNQYSFIEVESFAHTLSVGSTGYATLCLGFDAEIPTIEGDGNGVFIATPSTVAGNVHLTPITGVLPANTAVIVKAPAGTNLDFAYSTSIENYADIDENLLMGTLYDKTVAGEAYVLGVVEGAVGLYKATTTGLENGSFKNNANKAYLPAGNVANQSAVFYGFDWEGTTGIDEITDNRVQSTGIYDLTGRRIEVITSPGIYVVNGKKVLVK